METTIDSPYTAVPNVTELAAHGDVFLAGSNGYGIFRSVDRGMTWSASSLSGGGTSFYGFLDFAGYVFAAGGPYSSNSDSLYRSSDNGARWSAIKGHPSKALARVGNTLVETDAHTIYRSVDTGVTWILASKFDLSIQTFAVIGSDLFAATPVSGIFRSSDTASTWMPVNSGLTYYAITAMAVSDTNLFAATYAGGVFLSTDRGTSWRAVNTGLVNLHINSLLVMGQNLYAATDYSGVWRRPLSEFMVPQASVSDPHSTSSSQVYPNPTTDFVTISNTRNVSVLNMLGITVLDVTSHDRSDLALDVSNLPAGTYFVRSDGSAALQKLIKE